MANQSPHVTFYSRTFLYRTENFLYHQYQGVSGLQKSIVAQWAANLSEFQVNNLFVVEQPTDRFQKVVFALRRRLHGIRQTRGELPSYVSRAIGSRLVRNQSSVVYCIFGWHGMEMMGVLGKLKMQIPLVVHLGGSDVCGLARLGSGYEGRLIQLFRDAKVLLASSDFLRRRAVELGCPASKIFTHYIGVDVPKASRSGRGKQNRFQVIAVSRLSPEKGVVHTIRSFKRVTNSVSEARLWIVGDGPERVVCEEEISALGLEDRVKIWGSVPQAEVFGLMEKSDVFVQHNTRSDDGREEALGGTILEAAARSLPVVVTSSGGIGEFASDRETGLVVAPGDEEAMADAIVRMYRHPGERSRLGAGAREVVSAKFNVETQNERLSSILRSVGGSTHDSAKQAC
jgi:glycosyltransferase involved in cell wall biosynthesis